MNPTTPKRTRAYTTTAGERVTKFSDGTETRVGANPAPTVPATPAPVDLASGIPATIATAPASTLQTPPITPPAEVANETKSFGQEYLNGLQADAQTRLDQAQAPITEGERSIREAMGMLNTEADTRTKLEQSRGVTGIEQQMRQSEQSIAQQIAAIDDFDDSTVFNTEEMRIDASKRDITKATFGAQSAEYNLQRAIQRRGQAAQLRSTVAANAALQGNLTLATEQVDKALKSIYDPIRQDLEMEQFFLTRNDKRFDAAQKEVSDLRLKTIDRQFAEIDRANELVDSAVSSGYATPDDIKSLVNLSGKPAAQSEQAQILIARGIQRDIAEAKAAAAVGAGLMDSPETKNFGTTDAPIWKQWNNQTGTWEDVTGVVAGGTTPEQAQQSLDQVTFLRDTVARITGGPDPLTGGTYDALYESAGPNPTVEFLRRNVGSSATNFTRLEAQVDTLKTNALTLMADLNVKKFFGPQMSNNDVRLMASAATTLRPGEQTPEEVKAEALRYDDLFNRMETAVKKGLSGTTPVQGPVQPVNVITAPDGTQIEIID